MSIEQLKKHILLVEGKGPKSAFDGVPDEDSKEGKKGWKEHKKINPNAKRGEIQKTKKKKKTVTEGAISDFVSKSKEKLAGLISKFGAGKASDNIKIKRDGDSVRYYCDYIVDGTKYRVVSSPWIAKTKEEVQEGLRVWKELCHKQAANGKFSTTDEPNNFWESANPLTKKIKREYSIAEGQKKGN